MLYNCTYIVVCTFARMVRTPRLGFRNVEAHRYLENSREHVITGVCTSVVVIALAFVGM